MSVKEILEGLRRLAITILLVFLIGYPLYVGIDCTAAFATSMQERELMGLEIERLRLERDILVQKEKMKMQISAEDALRSVDEKMILKPKIVQRTPESF